MTTSVKFIAQDMGTIKDTVKKVESGQEVLSQKISDVENRPANETAASWSKIKVAVATSLVTAVIMEIFGVLVTFAK